MRAWEFIEEGLPVDDKDAVIDAFHMDYDDDDYLVLYNQIHDMEKLLDEKSDNYDVPAYLIFPNYEISSGIILLTGWIDELQLKYPWNKVLTTHCKRMLKYLKGERLDW